MIRKLAIPALPLILAACAVTPQYPVRPGEPRASFELPKPAYPITAPADAAPPPAPVVSRPAAPPPAPAAEAPTYLRPEPIHGAPPPPDEAGLALRGRQPGQPALANPREVVVRPGESLFEVAERVRTPIRAIIDLNGLEPPYDVAPGTVLKIPPPVAYTVKPGDTLLSVARRFSIDPRSLASLNDITLETLLKPGQRLALPSLVKDSQPSPRLATGPAAQPKPPPAAGQIGGQALAPPPPSAAGPSEPPPEAALAAGKGKFTWPIKGDILSTFGPKGPGQRNDGVNIAAATGQPVVAAAAGEVVYAGSTIPGFGNLVVIKHPDGWTSLYGNLGRIAVKIRAQVTQGQTLGLSGLSGAVDQPQVHFEVRYAATPQEKAKPVDPQALLP